MNYNKMSFVAGIVIFFSILVLFFSIIGLAESRIFFTHDYIVYVKFSDIIGLKNHSKVYMRGYKIGWTKDVQFESDGVVVRVDINKKFQLPVDSRFELNTVSLLGEKAITIVPGTSDLFLQPNAITTGQNKDIMMEAKGILADIKTSFDQGEVNSRLQQLSGSVTMLHSILGKLDTKLDDVNIAEYNQHFANIGKAGENLKNFIASNSDSLQASITNFNKTLAEITLLSEDVRHITRQINNGDGSAGAIVQNKKYIQNLNKTIVDLGILIEDFKKNPDKYINISVF